jgi:hypothetical protein
MSQISNGDVVEFRFNVYFEGEGVTELDTTTPTK